MSMQCCVHSSKNAARRLRRARYSTSSSVEAVRQDLRALLRETAQPVAVVTSLMPQGGSSGDPSSSRTPHSRFHGATLSSFSSIALDPHPLVAFSLRVPSRMAASLKDAHIAPPAPGPSHMVVNILSAAQAPVAVRFARPDLYPEPFADTPYSLTEEGLPLLMGALGALSCKLVAASWPLHDLESLESRGGREAEPWQGVGVASELFIARVTRVEAVPTRAEGDGPRTSPLLYYRRTYAMACAIGSGESSSKS